MGSLTDETEGTEASSGGARMDRRRNRISGGGVEASNPEANQRRDRHDGAAEWDTGAISRNSNEYKSLLFR